jgi:DNA-binding NarL/FixJ family response regulator
MLVLLVDDHALMRDGMALLMRHRFAQVQLLQAASLGEACICLGNQAGIELVLLDLNLRDSSGVDSVRRLRRAAPAARVVVLSAETDQVTVRAAIDAGASGFIPKTARSGVIEDALRQVLAGKIYLPANLLQAPVDLLPDHDGAALGGQIRPADPDLPRSDAWDQRLARAQPQATDELARQLGLAPRQADVFRLMLAGDSNKLIARQLALAESTVKSHTIAIFRKLNVSSRAEAMVQAAQKGVYEPRRNGPPAAAA